MLYLNEKKIPFYIYINNFYIFYYFSELTKDLYKVGRTNECDIEFNSNSINDNYLRVVSKVHFCIIRQVIDKKNNVVIFIEDNSSNGTFLNKKLIGKGKRCVLDHDDVISVSKASLAGKYSIF